MWDLLQGRRRLAADSATMARLKEHFTLDLDGDGGSAGHVFILNLNGYVSGLGIPFSFSSRISRFLLKLGRCGFNTSGINLDRMSKDRFPF